METKQVTVQPAVGGMIKASKDSFVIPKEELKAVSYTHLTLPTNREE